MKIAGMAVGVVFLVSMFENAITCVSRVRMAETFVSDLQLSLVRLEVLHLRLARWAKAVGLNSLPKDNNAANNKPGVKDADQKSSTGVNMLSCGPHQQIMRARLLAVLLYSPGLAFTCFVSSHSRIKVSPMHNGTQQ